MQPRTVGGKDSRVEPDLPALEKFLVIWQRRALQHQLLSTAETFSIVNPRSLFWMQLSWVTI